MRIILIALSLGLLSTSVYAQQPALEQTRGERLRNGIELIKKAYNRQQSSLKGYWDAQIQNESARIYTILANIQPQDPLPAWELALPSTIQPTDYAELIPSYGFTPRGPVGSATEVWTGLASGPAQFSVCLTRDVATPVDLANLMATVGRFPERIGLEFRAAGCTQAFSTPGSASEYPITVGLFKTFSGYAAPVIPQAVLDAIEQERLQREAAASGG